MEKNLGGTVKKFMFDLNDFDEESLRKKALAARKPTFSQEEMEASRQTGFEQGRIAGLNEAISSQESQIRDLCQQIVMSCERLQAEEADRLATFIDQSALIAVQALRKTLPVLLNTLAVDQIAAFVTKVLEESIQSQSIQIFVNPARLDAVGERLNAMAQNMRRKQAWTLAADPHLHDLQCKIEWTGGGASWDPQAVAQSLLDTITAHLPENLKSQASAGDRPESAGMDPNTQTPHNDETP